MFTVVHSTIRRLYGGILSKKVFDLTKLLLKYLIYFVAKLGRIKIVFKLLILVR